jgi:hypothetical protein
MEQNELPDAIERYFKVNSATICLVNAVAEGVLLLLAAQKKYVTGLFKDASESFKLVKKEDFSMFIVDIDKWSTLIAENQVKLLKTLKEE